MSKNNLFVFSKYGFPYIGTATLLFAVFYLIGCEFLATLFFFSTLFFIYIFRNPERQLLNFDATSIVSPCDGVVSNIEELQEGEYRYKVEIESSFFDLAVLRSPVNGSVTETTLQRGTKLGKNSKLFGKLNEKLSITFMAESGNSLYLTHQSKQNIMPIFADIKNGQTFIKSERFGFALNSVTTIYLPSHTRLNVSLLQKVKASESLLAYCS